MIMAATATGSGVMRAAFLVRTGEVFRRHRTIIAGKYDSDTRLWSDAGRRSGSLHAAPSPGWGSGRLEAKRLCALDPDRQLALIQGVGLLEADRGLEHERRE